MRAAWTLLTLLLCQSCQRPPAPVPPPLRVPEVKSQARAVRLAGRPGLRGSLVAGEAGDFLLENGVASLVVGGLASLAPGALLDAAPAQGEDALRALTPLVGVNPSPARFERAEVEHLGGAATVRLRGRDPEAPSVEVITEVSLHPGSSTARLVTTVVNHGARALLQYKLADLIDWGEAEAFAPGLGRAPEGRPALAWLGAWSPRVTYGYAHRGGLSADLTGPLPVALLETFELAAGARFSASRQLAIGRGGQLASLLPTLLGGELEQPRGAVELTVEGEEGDPIADAELEVRSEGKLQVLGRSGTDGAARLQLPPGRYQLRALTAERISSPQTVEVAAGSVALARLRLGPPSRLLFEVRDRAGALLPARLTILGLDDTPTPWLGPPQGARSGADVSLRARHQLLSPEGRGSLPLPPGRYRVIASRGPEHTIQSADLTLRPHAGASFQARLLRVVDAVGHVALDLGQRTRLTAGCAVDPDQRALASRVEGVAAVVTGEEELAARWAGAGPLQIVGLAGRSPTLGRYLAFPLAPGVRASELEASLEGGALIELEGARQPGGLLAQVAFDPAQPRPELIPPQVAALRLLDGAHPEDVNRLLADWLALLRAGRRLVATAGSGSRSIALGPAGWPRTYVEAPPGADAAAVIAALRGGRATLGAGVFARLEVNGKGPGETVTLPAQRRRRGKPAAVEVSVRVTVSAPGWVGLDQLTLYVHGVPWRQPIPIPGRADGVRLDQTLRVPVDHDGFVVAVVRGSTALGPVVELAGAPLPPLAITNPVWIDADGDGRIAAAPASQPAASLPSRRRGR